MDPKEILKRAENPDHIPGIYNYCDRWCERCSFSSRCLNRELSAEHEKNLKGHDISSKEYWDGIGKIFENTLKLISHVAEEQGIDLSKLDEVNISDDLKRRKSAGEKARNHLVSQAAKKYIRMTDMFFKKEKKLFKQKEDEMNRHLQLGINEQKIENEAAEIKGVLEIINWYNPQIWVKMMRALTGKFDGEEWQDENGFPRDSDGSAKVALVGIDRSIAAWGKLHEIFPDKTDEVISFLLHLDKLRKAIEREFPNARAFKRPGFDDLVSPNRC